MNNVITIDTITIRQDNEGRYCLNDLHKAAGGSKKHQPTNWLRLDSTRDLIEEITRSSEVRSAPASSIFGGLNQGTYVCKEIVYAYAMWISPAFHLKVIRAYDRLATQGVAVHENAAADLIANPLKYFELVLGQAKELQAKLAVAEPKAAVFDQVIAQKTVTVAAFARTLEGVNSHKIKSDLKRLGYLYQDAAGRYRVYSKHRDVLFKEKVLETYGNFDLIVLEKGKEQIVAHYRNGDLTLKKGCDRLAA